MRYSNADKEKANGVVYTPSAVAEYLATEMVKYKAIGNASDPIRILDPAIGAGELVFALLKTIGSVCNQIEVVGYDTDITVCEKTTAELLHAFPNVQVSIKNEDFLAAVEEQTAGLFDYVIANPPYIRTQVLGSEKAQELSSRFGLSGRVDIYYAFIVCTSSVLKDSGIAGYITSNKFLTIQSGRSLRDYILENYKIHQITDLGDTKLFSASVLPCIMVFSKGTTTEQNEVSFTSVYQTSSDLIDGNIACVFDAIFQSGHYQIPDGRKYTFQQGVMRSIEKGAVWRIESDETQKWLAAVERNTWQKFSDLGKIRVGIKTTADKIFIGNDWTGEKADIELLQPLITHRNAGQILPNNSDLWKVLYTHTTENGRKKAIDIDNYPKAKKYLLQYYEQLSDRKYVIQANRNWYEIWVPQNPDAWKHRKIVFRDISEHPQFWLDTSGAIVNGDCYWIDIQDHVTEDVVYLALAIANSKFIEKYYDLKFNTKLYSGKRRFMSQYVEQFPIPLYTSELAQQAIGLVKQIIAEKSKDAVLGYKEKLDCIVDMLFA